MNEGSVTSGRGTADRSRPCNALVSITLVRRRTCQGSPCALQGVDALTRGRSESADGPEELFGRHAAMCVRLPTVQYAVALDDSSCYGHHSTLYQALIGAIAHSGKDCTLARQCHSREALDSTVIAMTCRVRAFSFPRYITPTCYQCATASPNDQQSTLLEARAVQHGLSCRPKNSPMPLLSSAWISSTGVSDQTRRSPQRQCRAGLSFRII